ncbi:unnamed protein product [Scytosiphon promiscuus]
MRARMMWSRVKLLFALAVVGLGSPSSSVGAAATFPISAATMPPSASPGVELQLPLIEKSTLSFATETFRDGGEESPKEHQQPNSPENYRSRVATFLRESSLPVLGWKEEQTREREEDVRRRLRRRRRRWRPGWTRTAWTVPQVRRPREEVPSETLPAQESEPSQRQERPAHDGAGRFASEAVHRMRDFRRRLRSRIGDMKLLLEAAAGNHPEMRADEVADGLRRTLDRNQRELGWHAARANGLLSKWAAQVSKEERRLEKRLSRMRDAQKSLFSGVMTNAEARLQRAALENQVEGLRREWSDRQAVLRDELGKRQRHIAQRMRSVTEKSKVLAQMYDEFLSKKQTEMGTSVANEEAFERAIGLILEDTVEGGWEQVVSGRDGDLSVQRKFIGKKSGGSKFACVRAWCSMDVPVEAIAELFESPERVTEYNKWFLEGRDLELLDDDTKVVWACSPCPLPFVKPRDFVTVVNVRRLDDGTVVVVNRAHRHPDAPPMKEYTRGEVILAANVMRPDAEDENRTHFTMLTQVDPGGVAPAWIVNKISAHDPVDFLERVEAAAGRSKAARR